MSADDYKLVSDADSVVNMEQKVDDTDEKKPRFRSQPPLFKQPRPWLLITHGQRDQRQTFYDVSEGRYYIGMIPELNERMICDGGGDGDGWMYVEDYLSDYCFLLNIVTMEKIELPPLPESTSVSQGTCIISKPPTDPDCRVIFYSTFGSHIVTCNPKDDTFTTHELDDEYKTRLILCGKLLNGKLYGWIEWTKQLLIADPNEPSRFDKILLRQCAGMETDGSRTYLIESCGEILCVVQYSLGIDIKEHMHFEVFLADFSKMAWERLMSIGDRAIFLNQYQGFSCSTNELGSKCNRNSIYFSYAQDRNIYIFNLEHQSISIQLPCPIVSSRRSVLEWIMMSSSN